MMAIDITDTGKGMTSKQIQRVFEAGFTTKKRGWGLGLTLAKRIIVLLKILCWIINTTSSYQV